MYWCLAEAIRRRKLEIISLAPQIAVHHDGAGEFLMSRFTASDVNGKRFNGWLGAHNLIASFKSADSIALAKGLIATLKTACTLNSGCPKKSVEPKFQDEKYNHVRGALFLLDADAAADERRAMRIVSNSREEMGLPEDADEADADVFGGEDDDLGNVEGSDL